MKHSRPQKAQKKVHAQPKRAMSTAKPVARRAVARPSATKAAKAPVSMQSRSIMTSKASSRNHASITMMMQRRQFSAEPEQAKPTLYTKTHEYVRFDNLDSLDDSVTFDPKLFEMTVGISVGAADKLGSVVFVDPSVQPDTAVNAGDSIVAIESYKAVGTAYAPVNGKIIEFNSKLNDTPDAINTDTYTDGWIVKIQPDSDPRQAVKDGVLLPPPQYNEWAPIDLAV